MADTTKIQQYLRSQGVDENTDKEEVAQLKKEFWKQERVKKNREYRKRKKEVRFYYSKAEWSDISQTAKEHKMTVAEYVKNATKAYKNLVFMSPKIEPLVQLEKLVRNISANINSVVQFMHITRKYGESDNGVGKLRTELNLLFRMLKEGIEERPELYTWLQKDLEKYPERIERVKIILDKIEKNASH